MSPAGAPSFWCAHRTAVILLAHSYRDIGMRSTVSCIRRLQRVPGYAFTAHHACVVHSVLRTGADAQEEAYKGDLLGEYTGRAA